VIPVQNIRDLSDREPAHEQVTELAEFGIGPLPAGILRGRLVSRVDRLRIQHGAANQVQECSVFGIYRPGQERVNFNIGYLTA